MPESDLPGLPPSEPPRIELDPHPEPPPPAQPAPYSAFQAPGADRLEPESAWDPDGAGPVPWEDTEAIPGGADRWWATVKLGFTDVFGLADRVPTTESMLPAWTFHLLNGIPSVVLSLVLGEMTRQLMAAFLHTPAKGNPVVQLVGSLFGLLVGPFIGGAISHACLWMWGGVKPGAGLHQTIRFYGYAYGVYLLVGWIPVLNIPLAILFWIFFSMGLARVHGTDTWRGFAATLTPVVLCCCLIFGAVILVAGRL